MRGSEGGQGSMFSYVDLEQRIPHPTLWSTSMPESVLHSTVASSEAVLTPSSRDHHSTASPPPWSNAWSPRGIVHGQLASLRLSRRREIPSSPWL